MLARYCPEIAGAYYFGGEGNTGEAIRWGQALGGAVAFMDAYQAHASVAVPHGILITYARHHRGRRPGEPGRPRASATRPRVTPSTRSACSPSRSGVAWNVYDERTPPARARVRGLPCRRWTRARSCAPTAGGLARALGLPARGARAHARRVRAAAEARQPDAFGAARCRRLEPPLHGVQRHRRPLPHAGRARGRPAARASSGRTARPVPNLYAGGGVAAGCPATGRAGTSPATAS